MKSAKEILREYGKDKISTRPEFYSGRGNTTSDLNSEILETIYTGVQKEIGDKAAKSFVKMVGEMVHDASATTFLTSLYRLEQNNWKFNSSIVPTNQAEALAETVQNAKREGRDAAMPVSIGLVFIFASEAKTDKRYGGLYIVENFLRNHKKDLTKDTRETVLTSRSGCVY